MKTFTIYFVALFASALALPLIENDFDIDFDENFEDEFDERIVGGNLTTIQEHPHQISLRSRGRHICGGSVISPTRVVTSAHCLSQGSPPSQYTIMAGSTLRGGDANAQMRTLSRFIIHPLFRPNQFPNDIAVLHFEKALTFGANVRAIALPPHDSPVPYGRNCTVTGWGRTSEGGLSANTLKIITKPIVSNKECNRAYNGQVTPDMMCAGVAAGGIGACQGDSGGPLLVNKVILGVVSWGRGCARPGFPAVYARVAFFTKWIRENM